MNKEVNLTNCDREPIHIPGNVQSFGFLVALLADFSICIASTNVSAHLGFDHAELLQRTIADVFSPSAVAAIRTRIDYLSGEDAVTSGPGVVGRIEAEKPAAPRLSGTALIVEDNLIIALSAEVILLDLGARHVETAASVTEALNAIDRQQPSFALLDLNLGKENSIAVGNRLIELGIPFIFATGYGERAPIPSELDMVPVIQKPYTRDTIELAVGALSAAAARN